MSANKLGTFVHRPRLRQVIVVAVVAAVLAITRETGDGEVPRQSADSMSNSGDTGYNGFRGG